MKICIDCDPGVDDSLAILFALARPDVEVVGISTSVGNVTAIIGVGFDSVDALASVAPDYPDQKYASIDSSLVGEGCRSLCRAW